VASTRRPNVTVFHAHGCHLCERAVEQLRAFRAELDFDLEEIDITGVEHLEAKYREWLPVVEIDGRRAFVYHVQARDLRRRLDAQAQP